MAPLVGAPAPAFSAQAYMPDGSFKQLDLASFKVSGRGRRGWGKVRERARHGGALAFH
jgi:hypothetical protein